MIKNPPSALVLCAANGAFSQDYNLFPSADGWVWFNTQANIDRYVGLINETDYKVATGDNAKLIQLVYADQIPDYPASTADASYIGAGKTGVIGTEGSTTGALRLLPSSASMTANGGGFVVCMPSCSTFSIDYSCSSSVMGRIVATTNSEATMSRVASDCALTDATGWKIISAKYMSVFKKLPYGHSQWIDIEDLNNGSDVVTIQSTTPIYVWFQSATKDTIYIHGIKVTTPKQETASVKNVAAANDEVKEQMFSIDGRRMDVRENINALKRGLYIIKNGNGVKKISVK